MMINEKRQCAYTLHIHKSHLWKEGGEVIRYANDRGVHECLGITAKTIVTIKDPGEEQ